MKKKVLVPLILAVSLGALAASPPAEACSDCYESVGVLICAYEQYGYRFCFVTQCPPPSPEGAECCYLSRPCIYA